MAFLTYINKEGNLTEIPIDATNIQVLDIKGRFQHKNLEDVIGEIGTGSAENVSRIEQEIGEEELQTESGTIKGAINEVNMYLNEKANNIDLTNHSNNIVTSSYGAHGLKIQTGTWTPFIKGSTTSGSNIYATALGRFTKINNLVFCFFKIIMTSKDSAMSGEAKIDGLPFVSLGNNANRGGVSLGTINNVTMPSDCIQFFGEIMAGTSEIYLGTISSNAMIKGLPVNNLADTIQIDGSFIYETAI